jgi:hypothetical protein
MMDDLEPLDDDVLALLGSAKEIPALSPSTKAGLFSSVSARIGLVPPPGDDGGGPHGSSSDGSIGSGAAPGVSGAAKAGATKGGFALAGGKAVLALVGAFAIGIAAGVAIDRNFVPPSAAPMSPVAPVASFTPPARNSIAEGPAALTVADITTAPPNTARATVAAAPQSEPSAPPSPSARGLAAERALLDVARGALARGEAQEAFDASQRHAGEYPNGSLVEEREAIAIKALVALGRRDEAKVRAAEMERRFPNGLMLRAVKRTVERAP